MADTIKCPRALWEQTLQFLENQGDNRSGANRAELIEQLRALGDSAKAEPSQPIAVVTRFHDLGGEIDWTGRAIAPVGAKLYLEPQSRQEKEPDWSDSKTLPTELWKNPLLSWQARMNIADGAIHFRDRVIQNLRQQLAQSLATSRDHPIAWEWQRPCIGPNGETIGYDRSQITRSKDFLPHWPHWGLHRQPLKDRKPISTARIDELAEEGVFHGNVYEIVRRIEEEHDIMLLKSDS